MQYTLFLFYYWLKQSYNPCSIILQWFLPLKIVCNSSQKHDGNKPSNLFSGLLIVTKLHLVWLITSRMIWSCNNRSQYFYYTFYIYLINFITVFSIWQYCRRFIFLAHAFKYLTLSDLSKESMEEILIRLMSDKVLNRVHSIVSVCD